MKTIPLHYFDNIPEKVSDNMTYEEHLQSVIYSIHGYCKEHQIPPALVTRVFEMGVSGYLSLQFHVEALPTLFPLADHKE